VKRKGKRKREHLFYLWSVKDATLNAANAEEKYAESATLKGVQIVGGDIRVRICEVIL